jgi:hypothetical protein
VTEAESLAATDPRPMLAFAQPHDWATSRKQRLFACACCRRAVNVAKLLGHLRGARAARPGLLGRGPARGEVMTHREGPSCGAGSPLPCPLPLAGFRSRR